MNSKFRFILFSFGYLAACVALMAVGYFCGLKIMEAAGFMSLACTFIPLPADTYILHMSTYMDAVYVGLLGGVFNTIAVLFERYFVGYLLQFKKGQRIKVVFNESKLSHYFMRWPAAVLFIAAFTFVPFEPFRLLAITNNYNVWRYAAVTFIGRGTRYWLLAMLGSFMANLGWLGWVLGIALALYFIGLFKKAWDTWRKEKVEPISPGVSAPPEGGTD